MLDKLRSRLVHLGPSLMSVPVKLTPFALKRQVLEQVLSWQFSQALADGELEFLEGRWLSIHVRDIDLNGIPLLRTINLSSARMQMRM